MSRRRTIIALTTAAVLAGAAPAVASDANASAKLLPVGKTRAAATVVAKVRGHAPKPPKVHMTAELRRDKAPLAPMGRSGPAGGPAGTQITRPMARPDAKFNGSVGTYSNKLAWSLYYVDRYWASMMTGYRTPTLYAGMERYSAIYCGTYKLTLDNAWYCGNGNFITWDTAFLAKYFNWSYGGDMAVAAILAHEWGHLTANQLRLNSAKMRYSYYQELYADCQSGAFSANLRRQGKLDNLGVGDVNEVLNLLATIGDRAGTNWQADGAHGSASDRRAWWVFGWNNGPQACVNAVLS